jgi:hypothetical protein
MPESIQTEFKSPNVPEMVPEQENSKKPESIPVNAEDKNTEIESSDKEHDEEHEENLSQSEANKSQNYELENDQN